MTLVLARSSDSYLITLALMITSVFCTCRYGYWRIAQTWHFFQDPTIHSGPVSYTHLSVRQHGFLESQIARPHLLQPASSALDPALHDSQDEADFEWVHESADGRED